MVWTIGEDHKVCKELENRLHDDGGNNFCFGVIPIEVQTLENRQKYLVQELLVGISLFEKSRADLQGNFFISNFWA